MVLLTGVAFIRECWLCACKYSDHVIRLNLSRQAGIGVCGKELLKCEF